MTSIEGPDENPDHGTNESREKTAGAEPELDKRSAVDSIGPYWELFALGATALFVELLVIRWMSSDIRAFIVFRTFPLVACFIGFGTGFALAKKEYFKYSPILLLIFVVLMKVSEVSGIDFWQFPGGSVFQWQNLVTGNNSVLFLLQFILVLTVLLAAPFLLCMTIACRMGVLFNQLKPLKAYGFDLLGSFFGSLAFAAICALELEPWKLACAAALPLLILTMRQQPKNMIPLIAIVLLPFIGAYTPPQTAIPLASKLLGYQVGETNTYWSPYQRLDVNEYAMKLGDGDVFLGLELCTNRAFYQYFLNDEVSIEILPHELKHVFRDRRELYQIPFYLGPVKDVLVVGAGTGQNVAAALAAGAESVDAVDIDPVILRLGRKYNPVYSSPKVNLICDDARHFFNNCQKKYDLIIFTMLDSQAVVGSGSSVRLDAYVYTKESMQKAYSLLKPTGNMAVAFAIFQPWLIDRFTKVMNEAHGFTPLVIEKSGAPSWKPVMYFVAGERVKNDRASFAPSLPSGWSASSPAVNPAARTLTDDWPYLYVRPEIVDFPYFLVVGEILLISLFIGRRILFGQAGREHWQLFFLGAGFLLLELHAISFLSLLYGSTWLTSAVVINSILLMIVAANFIVLKAGDGFRKQEPLLYGALIVSILISYFFPPNLVLSSVRGEIGYLVISVVTILPMFIAGLLFPCALSKHKNVGRALGFNLFGSLVGGLLEYVSNYTGIRSLELLACALYLVSFLCVWRKR